MSKILIEEILFISCGQDQKNTKGVLHWCGSEDGIGVLKKIKINLNSNFLLLERSFGRPSRVHKTGLKERI